MITTIAFITTLSIVVPLGLLAGHLLNGHLKIIFPSILLALVAIFLALKPHQALYSGLDEAAYRLMAESFQNGRELISADTPISTIPENLRTAFRFRPLGPGARPTRDIVFETAASPHSLQTRPYFMPILPLAAAGFHFITYFPILIGGIWLICLFSTTAPRGRWSVLATTFLLLATPWPLYFMRGFFPDATSAFMVSCALLSTYYKQTTLSSIATGLTLGIAIAMHPTAILIVLPVYLHSICTNGTIKHLALCTLFTIPGIATLIYITRNICHPYGDWTRPETFRHLLTSTTEHTYLAIGIILLIIAIAIAITASFIPKIRPKIHHILTHIPGHIFAILSIAPILLLATIPSTKKALIQTYGGFHIPGIIAFLLASYFTFRKETRPSTKIITLLAFWTFIPFLLIKSAEPDAGIWSLRRLAQPTILTISAFTLASVPNDFLHSLGKYRPATCVLLTLILISNFIRSADVYLTANGKGTDAFRSKVSATINRADLTIFDYFPHAVPLMANSTKRRFAIGKHAQEMWPEIADFLTSEMATQKVAIVSSYPPPLIEENFVLAPSYDESTPDTLITDSLVLKPPFLSHKRIPREIQNHIRYLEPFDPTFPYCQMKHLNGSPLALRGNWHNMPHKECAWTRQGSGLIVPYHNAPIAIELLAELPPSTLPSQTITITTSWGGTPQNFTLSAGEKKEIHLTLPTQDTINRPTGTIFFNTQTPYDPAQNGQRGYPPDLGIILHWVFAK